MTSFFNALGQGYTPQQVLSYLSQAIPQFSPMIKKAQKAGYPAEQIVGFLSKNFETENRQGMSESERHAVNRRADAERTKYGLKIAGSAIATPLAAHAVRGALSRALPQSLTFGTGQTPPPNNTTNLGGAGPLGTGLAPTQGTIQPGTPQQQTSSSQPPVAQNLPQQAAPIQPEVKTIDLKEVLNKYPGFESKVNELLKTKNPPEAIAAYFKKFNASQTAKLEKETGKPIDQIIAEYASSVPEEETKRLLSKEEALGAFRNKQMIKHAQEEAEKSNVKPLDNEKKALPGESAHEVHKRLKIGYAEAAKLVDERDAIESPKIEKSRLDLEDLKFSNDVYDSYQGEKFGEYVANLDDKPIGVIDYSTVGNKVHVKNIEVKEDMRRKGVATNLLNKFKNEVVGDKKLILSDKTPEGVKFFKNYEKQNKIEKGSTVASPQGIGEVKEIRNGKAMLEIDGKKHVVDEDELESEPEDLEPAVRHILDSIPEKQKSSAFESSIHITLPTGQDLMVTKFYNGKWAWYIDVPENLYEDIATGVYSPKTTGKTGIAEYKPGVIDSRGAGFQSEIVQNPKYGKNEKGKTWGYANSKYNALEMIQGIINKISKEKYDEEGNPIQRKKRKKSD